MQVCARVQLFVIPWTVALQAPLPMEFSWQEYRSGLQFPPSGDLPNLGIKPMSPAFSAFQAASLPLSHQGSPAWLFRVSISRRRWWLFLYHHHYYSRDIC